MLIFFFKTYTPQHSPEQPTKLLMLISLRWIFLWPLNLCNFPKHWACIVRDSSWCLLVPHLTQICNVLMQGSLLFPVSLEGTYSITTITKRSEEAFEPQFLGQTLFVTWNLWVRSWVSILLAILILLSIGTKRKVGHNIQKEIHLIHLLPLHKIPDFLLSLDIYKLFDSLSWDYVWYVLK